MAGKQRHPVTVCTNTLIIATSRGAARRRFPGLMHGIVEDHGPGVQTRRRAAMSLCG
jgi:hypothetical protein